MSTNPQPAAVPGPGTPSPAGTAPPAAAASIAEVFGEEKEIWQGRSSWKDSFPLCLAWFAVAIVLLYVWWYFRQSVSGPWLFYLVAVVIVGSGLVVAGRIVLRVLGTRYRLTTQRLFIERGILSRTTDQTELIRIDDVRTRQSVWNRLFGLGDVELVSTDATQPRLLIEGVADAHTVAEHIRNNTRAMRSKRSLFVEQV